MTIFPDVGAEAAKIITLVAPLIQAAYWRGALDGAIGATLALLVLFAVTRRSP